MDVNLGNETMEDEATAEVENEDDDVIALAATNSKKGTPYHVWHREVFHLVAKEPEYFGTPAAKSRATKRIVAALLKKDIERTSKQISRPVNDWILHQKTPAWMLAEERALLEEMRKNAERSAPKNELSSLVKVLAERPELLDKPIKMEEISNLLLVSYGIRKTAREVRVEVDKLRRVAKGGTNPSWLKTKEDLEEFEKIRERLTEGRPIAGNRKRAPAKAPPANKRRKIQKSRETPQDVSEDEELEAAAIAPLKGVIKKEIEEQEEENDVAAQNEEEEEEEEVPFDLGEEDRLLLEDTSLDDVDYPFEPSVNAETDSAEMRRMKEERDNFYNSLPGNLQDILNPERRREESLNAPPAEQRVKQEVAPPVARAPDFSIYEDDEDKFDPTLEDLQNLNAQYRQEIDRLKRQDEKFKELKRELKERKKEIQELKKADAEKLTEIQGLKEELSKVQKRLEKALEEADRGGFNESEILDPDLKALLDLKCRVVGRSNYRIHEAIGFGTFGVVFRAVHVETKQVSALKIVIDEDVMELEVEIVKRFKDLHEMNEFICAPTDYFRGIHNDRKFTAFSMELHPVDLYALFWNKEHRKKRFPPESILTILAQIFSGLDFLNENGIIYSDLKEENVVVKQFELETRGDEELMMNPVIRLIDFNAIREKDADCSLCQTARLRAPEVILGLDFNENIDSWSAAVLALELLEKQYFFDFEYTQAEKKVPYVHLAHIEVAVNLGIPAKMWEKSRLDRKLMPKEIEAQSTLDEVFAEMEASSATDELQNLIRQLLIADPEERPAPTDVLALLKDKLPK